MRTLWNDQAVTLGDWTDVHESQSRLGLQELEAVTAMHRLV